MKKDISFENPSIVCILFLLLFVIPGVLHETLLSARLVSPIWLSVILGITLLMMGMRLHANAPKTVVYYSITAAICAGITILNGTSIGMVLIKIVYVYMGFVGFMLFYKKEMDLWPFDFLMLGLYYFFYKVYYSLLLSGQLVNSDEAFATSSSNAISICLVTVLFIYYFLNEYYNKKRDVNILLLSFANIVFIYFQGGRGGLIAAIAQSLVCIYGMFSKSKKFASKTLVIVFVIAVAGLLYSYMGIILDSYNTHGFERLIFEREDEARVYLLQYAIDHMDFSRFLLGYATGESIEYDNRTYNAFIDYWLKYGLLPFVMLVACTLRRILKWKQFNISIYVFLPLFLYTFAESYLTYGPWQYLLLTALFLGEKSQGIRQLQFKKR